MMCVSVVLDGLTLSQAHPTINRESSRHFHLSTRLLPGSAFNYRGRAAGSVNCPAALTPSTERPMPKAEATNSTPSTYRVTLNEALFLRCLLQCQNDHGIRPPRELGLPSAIGIVVDYDQVKRLIFTKMLRDEDNTPEGLDRFRKVVADTIRASRTLLMELGIVGSDDPFVWWTGLPVSGVKETWKQRAAA